MREEEVRRYAELMEKWDIRSLTVTDSESTISMERGGGGTPHRADSPDTAGMRPDGSGQSSPAAAESRDTEDDACVASPMIGVFYAAPAENAEPFVSVGDHVKKGDTLCIIEAMKLMNEVRAEQDGVVSKVCVTNGQVVEFGTELFRIGRQ